MDKTKPKLPNRWLVFAVVLLGSVCVAIAQFKVNGTLTFIMKDYGIDVTSAGLLGSMAALGCLLIALPGGSIVSKFGVRKVWLFGLALCCLANIGGYVTTNYTLLLGTRLLEGISIGFVFIVSPVVITEAFPAEKRGLPMMLWALWTTLGTLIVLNLCNVITPTFGWRANWLVSAVFLAVAFMFNFLFCKVEGDRVKAANNAEAKQNKASKVKGQSAWAECLKNPVLICICIVVLGSCFAFNAYLSYYPLFLQSTLSIPSAQANSVSTVHTYWMIVLCLTFGFVLNRIANKHHPKIFFTLTFFSLAGGVLMWNMPSIPLDIVAILLCGTGMQLIGPMSHNLVPDAVSARAMPIGMGILSFFTGVAKLLAPLVAGRIVDLTGNWNLVAVPVGIFALVGVAAALFVLKKMYKPSTKKSSERVLETAKEDTSKLSKSVLETTKVGARTPSKSVLQATKVSACKPAESVPEAIKEDVMA